MVVKVKMVVVERERSIRGTSEGVIIVVKVC